MSSKIKTLFCEPKNKRKLVFGITAIIIAMLLGGLIANNTLNYAVPMLFTEWDGEVLNRYNVIVSGTYIDSGTEMPGNFTPYFKPYEYVRILSKENKTIKISVSEFKDDLFYKKCSHNPHDPVRYAVVIHVPPGNIVTQQNNYKLVLKRELC